MLCIKNVLKCLLLTLVFSQAQASGERILGEETTSPLPERSKVQRLFYAPSSDELYADGFSSQPGLTTENRDSFYRLPSWGEVLSDGRTYKCLHTLSGRGYPFNPEVSTGSNFLRAAYMIKLLTGQISSLKKEVKKALSTQASQDELEEEKNALQEQLKRQNADLKAARAATLEGLSLIEQNEAELSRLRAENFRLAATSEEHDKLKRFLRQTEENLEGFIGEESTSTD